MGLFGLASLWYLVFGLLVFSTGVDLPDNSWGGLFVLAYEPILSLGLAVALLATILREPSRAVGPKDVLLLIFITPQFLGWAWVLFLLRGS